MFFEFRAPSPPGAPWRYASDKIPKNPQPKANKDAVRDAVQNLIEKQTPKMKQRL